MKSRRAVLTAAAGALVVGCTPGGPLPEPPALPAEERCREPGELVDFSTVGTGTLLYDETGAATTLRIEPKFLRQLDAWADDWAALSGLGAITSVTSYGAYVDKCNSYHQIGQAFDITGVAHEHGKISLHYDQWQPGTDQQLRDYWRLAASIHLHFAYTLAYPYNANHHNHIHFDNAVSGAEQSTFQDRSGTQLQMVQHGCRHVFGHDVELTGEWDGQTKDAVRKIQQAAGITQPMSSPDGWRAFLRAVAKG